MALLDVNALVALAWDSHIHHARIREWFTANATLGWATCPLTEAGFVRVSTNPKVLPSAIGIADARPVLVALRAVGGHRFLADDVSLVDDDVPLIVGYRHRRPSADTRPPARRPPGHLRRRCLHPRPTTPQDASGAADHPLTKAASPPGYRSNSAVSGDSIRSRSSHMNWAT